MEQMDLFGAPTAPELLTAPVPSARPSWTQMAPRAAPVHCAHCVLVAAQRGAAAPKIRSAVWIRMGVLGETTVLCTGHRDIQRIADATTYQG